MIEKDLPIERTFRWSAVFTTEIPFGLSSERRSVSAFGTKTWKFLQTHVPQVAKLSPVDERITVRPITLFTVGPQRVRQLFQIPEFTISGSTIDSEKSFGYIELETGRFSYQFEISLTKEVLPILAKLGIPDFRLLVQEGGVLPLDNPEEGMVDASGQFFILQDESALNKLQTRSLLGTFSKCGTYAKLRATAGGDSEPHDKPPENTVYICPGEKVRLFWEYSDDVTHAEITPDVGVLSSSPGSTTVSPSNSTTYELKVTGSCSRTDKVKVVVVTGGTTTQLLLNYVPSRELFYLSIPREFVSDSVRVTSLQPACMLGCFIHEPPIINYLYLDCGNYLCNGAWNLQKIDIDGFVSNYSIWNNLIPVDYRPLAGEYKALPQHTGTKRWFGSGLFIATLGCRKPEKI